MVAERKEDYEKNLTLIKTIKVLEEKGKNDQLKIVKLEEESKKLIESKNYTVRGETRVIFYFARVE